MKRGATLAARGAPLLEKVASPGVKSAPPDKSGAPLGTSVAPLGARGETFGRKVLALGAGALRVGSSALSPEEMRKRKEVWVVPGSGPMSAHRESLASDRDVNFAYLPPDQIRCINLWPVKPRLMKGDKSKSKKDNESNHFAKKG